MDYKIKEDKLGTPKSIREDAMYRQIELGDQLRYIRQTAHFSVRDMERITGLSKKTIWKLESGRPVNLSSLMIVLEALGYEPEFLRIGDKYEKDEFEFYSELD